MISFSDNIKGFIAVILSFLILLASILSFPAEVFADDNKELKTVRLAVEDSGIFFATDENGALVSGYAYDYIQAIANYANWNVEYLPCASFIDCLEMVNNGQADLFYDVSFTEERSEWLLYPDYTMGTEDYYIFCNSDNNELHADDISTFSGKKVGVTAGTIEKEELQQWSKDKGISLDIIEFESDPEKEEKLRSGELDMEYEISMLVKGDFSALLKISSSDFYLVTNKNRPDLLNDINDASAIMLDVDKYFIEHLNEKYFSKSVLNRTLSKNEGDWVQTHYQLNVGYVDNYMPFSDTLINGKPNGIIKDLIPHMLETLGLEMEFVINYVPYNNHDDMLAALTKGEIDLAFPVIDSTSFGITYNIITSSEVISLSADLVYSGSYSDSKVKTIAVDDNNLMQEYFTSSVYPNAELVFFTSDEECLNAVKDGIVGSTILSGMSTTSLLVKSEYDSLNAARLSESIGFSFAVAKGNSALLSILNRSISCMDDGLAINYALNYIGAEEADSFIAYISSHKLLIMMIISAVLAVALIITTIGTVMTKRAKKKLADANQAKTSFLFNMSHDIRTPMNAILGFTDMAKKNMDNKATLEDCLNKTEQAGSLLLSLINSVLEMSRIEAGKAELEEKPCKIDYCFENIKTTMHELAKEKNIDLSFEVSDITNHYIFADMERGSRIFINLVSNAIKYTHNEGRVKVKCQQVGCPDPYHGLYRFTFEDNGIGMSDDFQKHLFDEFAREQNSTSSGIQGSGLGLSVTKSFVELMGGTIEFTSKQGSGTTFIVTLPFKLQPDHKSALFVNPTTGKTQNLQQKTKPNLHKDLKGKKILLVEDNEMNREIARFLLEEQEITVEEANDGIQAVELLKEKGPDYYDAILMDIQMPIMNGYEATRAIRAMYRNAEIPIIAVSANAFSEDKAASLKAGMNDHIAKPINKDELFSTIAKYL